MLWAGDGLAAVDALERLGVHVTRTAPERCAQHVARRAPDLIVLEDLDSARADALMNELRAREPGATIPVIVVSRGAAALKKPVRRAGLVARLAAERSADELAAEIHARIVELAAHTGVREVSLAPDELDDWLAAAAQSGACGLLVSSEPAAAIAVGSGSTAPSLDSFRAAFALAAIDEPLALQFWELSPRRLHLLSGAEPAQEAPNLAGASVVVVVPDAARRTLLSGLLENAGAQPRALDADASELERVASFAPLLVVIAASALARPSTASLWRDARLASVSFLVVEDAQLSPDSRGPLLSAATRLIDAHHDLQQRFTRDVVVVGRIETFGTAGWLKEISRSAKSLTLRFESQLGRGELSLAEGKIRDATFVPADGGEPQKARAALQAALAMPFGRVFAGPHEALLAFDASPPPEAEADAGDFLERPTSERASIKPRVRSFRPSAPDAQESRRSVPGLVVPLPPLPAGARGAKNPTPLRASTKPRRISERPGLRPPGPPLLLPPRERRETSTASAPLAEAVQLPEPAPEPRIIAEVPAAIAAAAPQNETTLSNMIESALSEPAPAVAAALPVPLPAPLPWPLSQETPALGFAQPKPAPRRARWPLYAFVFVVLAGAGVLLLPQPTRDVLIAPIRKPEPETASAAALAARPVEAPSPVPDVPADSPPEEVAEPAAAAPKEPEAIEAVAPASPVAAPAAEEPTPEKPADVRDLVERAKQAREQERYQEAETVLREALSFAPDNFSASYQLALTLLRLRRFEDAHEQVDRASALNADSPLPLLLQGDIFLQEGQRTKAVAAWRACLEASPEFESCAERLSRWATRAEDGAEDETP